MLSRKKNISVSVLILGAVFILVGCRNKFDYKKDVVKLEEQKTAIDQNIIVKSVKNLEEFHSDRWWNNNLLGVRNQPVKGNEDSEASIVIYDIDKSEFKTLVKGKKKEWLMIGENYKNELIYTTLIDGDFKRNLYSFNILNMDTKGTEQIITGTSSISNLQGDMLYIAKDMEIYRFDFKKGLEKIELPKDFINDLNNFEEFTFADYLEMYYLNDSLHENQLQQIKENYEYSKANNSIRIINNLGNKIRLTSSNGKTYDYDINTKTYYIEKPIEQIKSRTNSVDNIDKKLEKVYWESVKGGTNILWKMDLDGNKNKIIERFSSKFNMALSPDETKVVYNSKEEDDTESSFIYDLNTDEKIKIFPEITGRIYWNDNSDKFFIDGRKFDLENRYTNMTSLIELK